MPDATVYAMRLREALIKFLKSIGRWLLDWLRRHGARLLEGYVLGKIDDFQRRLAALAKKPARWTDRRWARVRRRLRARIRRWSAFAEMLEVEDHAALEREAINCSVDDRIAKLPLVAKGEKAE